MFRALILDLDGTLADTLDDIHASLNHALAAAALPGTGLDRARESVGGGVGRLIERIVQDAGKRGVVESAFRAHYADHLLDRTKLYPGAREALGALRDLPMAVLSNKPEAMARKVIEGLGISGFFRAIFGGDSMPVKKPHPEAVGRVLAHLGSAPIETLMVGDSRFDLESGRGAGLRICAVTWGYAAPGDLAGADFTIDSFAKLPAIVRK